MDFSYTSLNSLGNSSVCYRSAAIKQRAKYSSESARHTDKSLLNICISRPPLGSEAELPSMPIDRSPPGIKDMWTPGA
jgi:hypothetical protein